MFRVAGKIQLGLRGIAHAIADAVPPAAVNQDVVAPIDNADVPQAAHEGNYFENDNANDVIAKEVDQPPQQQFIPLVGQFETAS